MEEELTPVAGRDQNDDLPGCDIFGAPLEPGDPGFFSGWRRRYREGEIPREEWLRGVGEHAALLRGEALETELLHELFDATELSPEEAKAYQDLAGPLRHGECLELGEPVPQQLCHRCKRGPDEATLVYAPATKRYWCHLDERERCWQLHDAHEEERGICRLCGRGRVPLYNGMCAGEAVTACRRLTSRGAR